MKTSLIRWHFIAITSIGAIGSGISQHVDIENIEQRIKSIPYYSYGRGLGFTSPDSLYQMNIRFRMQSRATFQKTQNDPMIINGQVRRLRLRLDGYVGDPKFSYALQLSFAPGDLGGALEDGQNIQIIRDAVMYYSINKHMSIGFGQTKLPGNRQRVNSSGALQLTDRSINNATFNLDRDFGIQFHYISSHEDAFKYNIIGAISQGEGRNITANMDAHLAYTGKIELYPLGVFQKNGAYFEGDLKYEMKPKVLLSFAHQYNVKARRTQGQLGDQLYASRDLHTSFIDAVLKYRGWAFMAAYMQRSTDQPITTNTADPSQFNYVLAGMGYDLQSSYNPDHKNEFIVRYSNQIMDSSIRTFHPNQSQYTIGYTRYIWEHSFKLQLEATYNDIDSPLSSKDDHWYIRLQLEMGI